MTQETLDLRRSLQIVRRHRIAVGVVAALGLLAGVAFGLLYPSRPTSSALIVLAPTTRSVPTQVVIAGSEPVLQGARKQLNYAPSMTTMKRDIHVRNPNPDIISVSATGKSAAQAEQIANAVAHSYVAYASTARQAQAQARVLQPATTATQRPLPLDLLMTGGIGAVLGALIGAIGVLALKRGDRRLQQRDEIANVLGVPVLASIPVGRPGDTGRWTRLFEDYDPSDADAWQLRNALRYLGSADVTPAGQRDGAGLSVAVLSLASDRGALALGPQLAIFAASVGIPTLLVIGTQQDSNPTAALRAACVAPPSPKRSGQLQVIVADDHASTPGRLPRAKLTVVVGVVDGQAPRVADTMPTTATVLGVSAGEATAMQLASVAVSAANDDRQIDGILVANPDPKDQTTGRIPQLARPPRRITPTRLTNTPTETTR